MIFSRENQKVFRVRASSLALVVSIVLAFLLLRLAWLQIIEHEKHSSKAEDNRVILLPQQAPRGMIFDRNLTVMARNDAGFYLELQPSKIEGFQKTIKKLREVIEITKTMLENLNGCKRRFDHTTASRYGVHLATLKLQN